MKTSKSARRSQLKLLDRKINEFISLKQIQRPKSGWLKAIRTSIGMTSRQLSERLGVKHQTILKLESSEIKGTATLDSISRHAEAMDCQFIYAIVPRSHQTLEELIDAKALKLAHSIVGNVAHSMKLEGQGISSERTEEVIRSLASELRDNFDVRLWM